VSYIRHFYRFLFVLILFMSGLGTSLAMAQVVGGTIAGDVVDPAGSAVSGARVLIRDQETGTVRELLTSDGGTFSAPSIPVGAYSVTISHDGFAPLQRTAISLAVGQGIHLHLTLTVGGANETVSVVDTPQVVDLSTQQSQGLVNERQVKELPLNGRSYDQLIELNPGAVSYTTERSGGVGTSNSSVGNMFSVSGRRPQDNLFLLNGVEYTGASLINVTPGGTSGQLLGVDAVREFNVVSDTYGANYGKRTGAQISIVTASGGNALHGSVYEFLRNSALDARNYFDQAKIPEFQRNNFGAALGGPLRHDKLFAFGNYEGYRQNLGVSAVAFVPDDTSRAAAVPSVKPVLALWPVANGPELLNSNGTPSGIAEAFSNPPQNVREDFGTTRVDANLTPNDLLFGVYTIDDSDANTPSQNPYSTIYATATRTGLERAGAACLFSDAAQHGALRIFACSILLHRRGAGTSTRMGRRSANRCGRNLGQHSIKWRFADHTCGCEHRKQQRYCPESVYSRRSHILDARQASDRSWRLAATAAIERQPCAEPIWTSVVFDAGEFSEGRCGDLYGCSRAHGVGLAVTLRRRLHRRCLEGDAAS
jgi:Carboxypeptidase regulatory-like domain